MAKELLPHNVTVVSLWPGAVATETVKENILKTTNLHPKLQLMFGDPETTAFAGKAVAALASDPQVMDFTGRVLQTVELAHYYKFTEDETGRIPGQAVATMLRNEMSKPPSQWRKPAKL